MYSSWLVTNHALTKQTWALINQCEVEGKSGSHYIAAVEVYTAPPDGYATTDGLVWIKDAHYGPATIPWSYDEWENWGATQFHLAIDEANLRLAN